MANLSNINGKFVVEQTTGYVGVGTTDPNFLIEAAGANSEIALNSTSASIYRLRSTSSDSFIITKNGVGDRLVINGSGNATFAGNISGISATFNGGAGANATPLTVGSSNQTNFTLQQFQTSSHGTNGAYLIAYGAGHGSQAGNFAMKNTLSGKNLFFEVNNSRELVIENGASTFAGNVGIGGTPSVNFEVNKTGARVKLIDGTNQLNMGLWDGVNYRFEGDANRPMFFTSYQGNINFGISGGTNMTIQNDKVGIGTTTPDGKLEVAGGTTLGFRLSNAGDSSAYDQVRMTYGGYNSGAPTVTFMPLTTPGGGNVYTTFLFQNTNGINASANNNANVAIDGTLQVGRSKGSGETTLIMNNYDTSLAGTNQIQNSIRMSGRYWSNSASQLVETRINSVHQLSDGNGGSALTFMTQTGGSGVVEQMRIDRDGNVGIGTNIPGAKLSIGSGVAKTSTSTSEVLYLGQSNEASNYSTLQVYTKGGASQADRSVVFQTIEAGVANAGNIVLQPSGGNVAIGRVDSRVKLEIQGAGQTTGNITDSGNSGAFIQVSDTGNGSGAGGGILFSATNDSAGRTPQAGIKSLLSNGGGQGSGSLSFSTRGSTSATALTERVLISADGKTEFGNPAGTGNGRHLIVNSFSYTTLMQGTSTANVFVIRNGTGLNANVGMILFESNAGGASGQITTNSSTNTTSYNTSGSDERLKKNITDWNENVLDKFKDIQPKKFHFKTQNDDSDKIKGYIAQNEVDKFPEAYPLVEDKESGEKRYLFNPSGMNVYLMKAIQELKADNDSLRARIETLENN